MTGLAATAEKIHTALEKSEIEAREAKEDEEFENDNGYSRHWPETRIKLARILNSTQCDLVLGIIVLFNLYLVIAETDHDAKSKGASLAWLKISNAMLLVFYSLELCIRLYTFREKFFKHASNLLDFTLVCVDLLMLPLSLVLDDVIPLSFLRMFRLLRLARSKKMLELSPELSLMVRGLRDTAKTILWGAIMILLTLTVWSILAVEIIHPINQEVAELTNHYDSCDRCARAYESVWQSNITLFQSLIAGDSWGHVVIPIIEHRPSTAIFFLTLLFTVHVGLMNLLLAVLVERASSARASDVAAIEAEEEAEAKVVKHKLVTMCREMDLDSSGELSLEELLHGYKNHADFRLIMHSMDIEERDMAQVYRMLDDSKDGSVAYEEFAEALWKMKSTDDHTLLLLVKFDLFELKVAVDAEMELLKKNITSLVEDLKGSVDRSSSQHEEISGKLVRMSSKDPPKDLESKNNTQLAIKADISALLDRLTPRLDEIAQMVRQSNSYLGQAPRQRDTTAGMIDRPGMMVPSCCALQPIAPTNAPRLVETRHVNPSAVNDGRTRDPF